MTSDWNSLDLSRLRQLCVFRSHSALTSHELMRRELADHLLRWRGTAVDTSLCHARMHRIELYLLRYGAEVEVEPRVFSGFSLVQMPLHGVADIDCDGQQLRVGPGQAAVIAPRRSIRLVWGAGCEQLLLKLPDSLVEEASTLARPRHALAGPAEPQRLPAAALLPVAAVPPWQGVLRQLLHASIGPTAEPADGNPAAAREWRIWREHFEQNVALFLLASLRTRDAPSGSSIDGGLGLLLQAEIRLRSRLHAPLALADLALAVGITARQLNELCHAQLGVSPMAWLRRQRLDAARASLLAAPPPSVTEVAIDTGFGHLGRFSAYYRERFGELPQQTVRRQGQRRRAAQTRTAGAQIG